MRTRPFVAHGACVAVALAAMAGTSPCLAQAGAPAPPPPASAAPRVAVDQIVALARLSVDVGHARDSVQRQLAQSRNKTPQAQQQLRERLAIQIAAILHHASTSDDEYRRRMYLVSTDTAARALFDQTVARATGAPLPGVAPATVATSPVRVPEGPVGAHLAHVMNAFADAPGGRGLLPTALAEARIASVHATLATREPANLDAMRLHAGHVIHAIDPTLVATGPGLGYGVRRAALAVGTHVDLAAKAAGAAPPLATHAGHVGASVRNTLQRADEIVALAKRIQVATTAADAASLTSQLASLTNELVAGRDADADGRIGWKDGEGGLQHCDEHVRLMLAPPAGG